ncbi:hypothetical protein Emin_1435 [Elusimicrobium minutum Pei191]|uniref:Uncharacterized protein n=1 Tax=Elusimicrobium minutum (strain Pei191) TaxID=445932 RepID=B2KEN8_ELUMP|nr:hypothetical protein [Elusimicrobium minutum]ACC98984.1 hypothetical protein Emin_1435 [Elusimicrobium minutum Pei191]
MIKSELFNWFLTGAAVYLTPNIICLFFLKYKKELKLTSGIFVFLFSFFQYVILLFGVTLIYRGNLNYNWYLVLFFALSLIKSLMYKILFGGVIKNIILVFLAVDLCAAAIAFYSGALTAFTGNLINAAKIK